MSTMPKIKLGDWIRVGNWDCVVRRVYDKDSPFGVGEVVYNPQKPTTHDFDWNGDEWFLPERPDYGGHGRETDPYVQQLKRGKVTQQPRRHV